MSVEQRIAEETKQAQMKKQWSTGFSWADDSDSDSDDDCDEYCYAPSLVKSPSQISLGSSRSSSSSSSSIVKSVRFAPIAEMRLIPSLVDLSEMARGTRKPQVFVENNARTIIL
mmetsp:Transcript_59754/g.177070  ORF Transcript_59754/g.177070 Transcript_59754/m.177070 type:complete len:114 (-) Transcript_59754:217-558(-)|eukprot:CAMPEP_0113540336 /NCGR_PEP_ID=MMETSP0015_2-20120614/8423_1 /TAXON_ID=2838 /ORGANISM="Odontella" /LENGTH=113 /DNA_ID=CAMNT_0000440127 /DNA_START=51 /DNA_END=392 /DNA_ORIENTATION=- /assembly_acc=CAM_ASM_000160